MSSMNFSVDPRLSTLMSIAEIMISLSIAVYVAYLIIRNMSCGQLQRIPLVEQFNIDDVDTDALTRISP